MTSSTAPIAEGGRDPGVSRNVEQIAAALGTWRQEGDRSDRYRPLVVDIVRELSLGEPVSRERVEELASDCDAPASTVARLDSGAEWDDGSIVGINGLTLLETRHHLRFDDVTVGTWCAWDPLFLVPIIGRPATLESTSPTSGIPLRVDITPDGVAGAVPETTVLSVVLPEPTQCCTNVAEVQATFCHFVNFFEDAAAAADWLPANRETAVLDLDDGFRLARLVYGDLFAAAATGARA